MEADLAFNGSGTFNRVYSWQTDSANGINITDSRMDAEMDGFATGLSNCVTKDGQTIPTANLPMATFRHTGVGNAAARTDYAAAGQVQDGSLNWVDGGGTADAITATYAPALTTLVDGQLCFVRATAANATTTPTFSPSGLTARTMVKHGGVALAPGDIVGDGHQLILRYDLANTRWELLNPAVSTATSVTAASTFGTDNRLLRSDGTGRGAQSSGITIDDSDNVTLPGTLTASGTVTMNSKAFNEAYTTIASASTVSIGAAAANYLQVTGTTTITAFDTVQAGTQRVLEFAGILTLTHNSTSLILPGGASITTAAGDCATMRSEGSGNWRCINYTKANGTSVIGGDVVKLTTAPASSSTSLDFTASITSTYRAYMFVIEDLAVATDDVALWLRVSEDAGSNWKSSASDYAYVGFGKDSSANQAIVSSGAAQFALNVAGTGAGIGNAAGKTLSGTVIVHNPSGSSKNKRIQSHVAYAASANNTAYMTGGASYIGTTNALNGVRFLASSGNLASGTITMFGIL